MREKCQISEAATKDKGVQARTSSGSKSPRHGLKPQEAAEGLPSLVF